MTQPTGTQPTDTTRGRGLWAVLRRTGGKATLTAAVAGALLEAVGGVAAAGALGWLVGAAATGTAVGDLVPAVVVAVVAVLAAAGGNWALGWCGHAFAFRAQAYLRLQALDALDRSAPRGLQGRRSGDVATTVMGDVDALEEFFAHLGIGVVVAGAVGVTATLALVVVSPWLAVTAAVGMLLAGVLPLWTARRGKVRAEEHAAEVGALNADVVDGVGGIRELVVFGAVTSWWRRIDRGTASARRLRLAHARAVGLQSALTEILVAATVVGVLTVAVGLVASGTLTLAGAALAVSVVLAALTPVTAAIDMAGSLAPLRAAASRLLDLLDAPADVSDPGGADVAMGPPDVRFEGVTFGYRPGVPVVRGVDLDVPAGSTVALVGRSGAGKTSVANLLLRFWDPDAGRVSIGGHDLRDVPLRQLRALVGVVGQEAHLFAGTVAENLRLGAPDATDGDLERAARAAQAHEFVLALPDGYDTEVGERGALLSGGQRQRLTIARALLADPPVLVLDEASANLDARNEALVTAALAEAARGRTTLVIAHRLSTVRRADVVVVLDGGRVVESGPPAELAERGGPYAQLIAHQREGTLVPAL